MKKIVAITLAAVLCLGALAGCGSEDDKVITVGASITPHAEILEAVRGEIEAQGYELEIVEYTDYVLPNESLNDGSLDANYFQHGPYLETFNAEHGYDLASAAAIHYEPMGIYPGAKSSLDELAEGDTIAIPNDGSNETRALLLLQDEGYITLKEGINASSNATVLDIAENPLDLDILEMAAENIPNSLPDVAFGIINGNYALQAGLTGNDALQAGLTGNDALASEDAASDAAQTYANIVAVRPDDLESEKTQALVSALTSETCREFIESTYSGAVVPIF